MYTKKFYNVAIHNLLLILFVLIPAVKNIQLENQSGSSIIDGNCGNATDKDRAYYDHVYKNAIPLFVRSETDKIYVNDTIYCVTAENQKSNETGGTAEITAGGVGQKYVIIQLDSYRGHGLDFYVSVYTKNGTRTKAPMTVVLENP